ncbi:MAG TPA: response regulator [Steroidobacteraceae bacterium]|nr:response regulator [Steroidobacteraceae bacterium]
MSPAARGRIRRGSISSVRGQLTFVVLLTTAMALLTMTGALLYRDLTDYRQAQITDLTTEAEIITLLTTPALSFEDRQAAERNLAALSAKPEMLTAALYSDSGELYASYARRNAAPPPARAPVPRAGVQLVTGRLELTRAIQRNGEHLGVLYLSAAYDPWTHVRAYVGVLGLMMLLSLAVALVLSARLRGRITGPVEALAALADDIVTRRDPARRAPAFQLEEFSVVAQAFNSVLDESEGRTRELQDSNRALRKSENLYRAIGESIDYGVWVTDAEGRNIYASDSFLKLLGVTQAQCSDLGWSQALHPDDVEGALAAWRECVRTGGVWYRELRFRGADNRYHPVLAQGVPMREEDGRITGWAGINLDIARMKKTENALRKANRRKDDFLATLAHELRNPLAPIRHAARLLGMKGLDPAQHQMARDIIGRQVARMALLLDDLLEVSRITRGRLELRKEHVSLAALVKAAVETSKPLLEAKQHEFTVRMPEVPVELEVDPLRISQALSNLLTNAAKYTDAGGQISLEVRSLPGETVFEVRDSGIGLPAAALPTIFEMFSQVDSAIDRSEGGLGIGLALVKGLVALHGGNVEAASEGPGKGSLFTMRIPGGRPAEPAATHERRPALQEAATSRGRILVVDDNVDAAATLAMVLRSYGHTVATADCGKAALAIGEQQRPDVVILDIGMPDMNGYEVAQRLRQTGWGSGALLVALTGWGQKEDIERAHRAGFDSHMTKPADPEEIETVLEDFLKSRRAAGIAREAS